MAKRGMITRTIVSTKVNALCIDTVKCEPMNHSVVVTGTYTDGEKLLKAVKDEVETEDFKVVKIVDKIEQSKVYGMDELDFLANAKELDENRKPIETTVQE